MRVQIGKTIEMDVDTARLGLPTDLSPAATWTFAARSAATTWPAVSPRSATPTGSSQTLIE
jgi:hypothetical protein